VPRVNVAGMDARNRLAGYTLIELLAVLATFGIALAIAAPALARSLDGVAVRAARDAVVVELARARLLARLHGGATVVLDARTSAVWTEAAGERMGAPLDLRAQYRASLGIGGDERASVEYDRLGLGRLANRTILLTRGGATARVTVSAYGRVREW
jgi:prepilin-type N-terminal cleavage/methylation domain-containing protein